MLDPLLHRIQPGRSSYTITPSSVIIRLLKQHPGQHWQYLDADGIQPEVEPVSPSTAEDSKWFFSKSNKTNGSHSESLGVPIQIMSDLHLELFFPRSGSIGVQPGYTVFECTPSARVLALLGDIGLAAHGGLYDFLERQLHKYRHILYVIGNHEGYQSTYVSAFSLIIGVISDSGHRIMPRLSYKILLVEYVLKGYQTRPWAHSFSSIDPVLI